MLINNENQDLNDKECQDWNQCCLFEQCNMFWRHWLNGSMNFWNLQMWTRLIPYLTHCCPPLYHLLFPQAAAHSCDRYHLQLLTHTSFPSVFGLPPHCLSLNHICLVSVKRHLLWQSLNEKMVTGPKWTFLFSSSCVVKPVLYLSILLSQAF